jgi:hypothetical protein
MSWSDIAWLTSCAFPIDLDASEWHGLGRRNGSGPWATRPKDSEGEGGGRTRPNFTDSRAGFTGGGQLGEGPPPGAMDAGQGT